MVNETNSQVRLTPNHSYWIMPDGSVEDVHGDLGANGDGSKYSHGIFAANWVKQRRQQPERFLKTERETAERIEKRSKELARILTAQESTTEMAGPFTEMEGRWYDEDGKQVDAETVRAYRPKPIAPETLEGFDDNPGELAYKHAAQEEGWLRVRPQTVGMESVIFVESIDPKKITPAQSAVIESDVVRAGYRLEILAGGAMGNSSGFKLGKPS